MWNGIPCYVEDEAVTFLYTEVGKYEWIKLSTLARHLGNAPQHIRSYMKKHFTEDDLEEFLDKYEHLFYIENDRVAQFQDSFDVGYEQARAYCQDILATYLEPVDLKRFRGHLGQASPEARDFMKRFYSDKEFEKFFLCNDDVFVVYENNTVWLIESDCVRYFKQVIEDYGGGEYFKNFRGHIGQAPSHIIDYINETYPNVEFLDFLRAYSDVFDIDEELNVFLQPQ